MLQWTNLERIDDGDFGGQFRKLRVAHFSRVVELFFVLSKRPTGSGSNRDFSLSVLKSDFFRGTLFFQVENRGENRLPTPKSSEK